MGLIIIFILICPLVWLIIKYIDRVVDKEIEEYELIYGGYKKRRLGELLTWDDINDMCQMTIKDMEHK